MAGSHTGCRIAAQIRVVAHPLEIMDLAIGLLLITMRLKISEHGIIPQDAEDRSRRPMFSSIKRWESFMAKPCRYLHRAVSARRILVNPQYRFGMVVWRGPAIPAFINPRLRPTDESL